jgi:uncharacterized protein YndB with AHSA1/START domain
MTSSDEHLLIRRSEEIDLDIDAVWELISTADGWSAWLVDDAHLEIAPGRGGVVRDDGRERLVRVDTMSERHRVAFTWWDGDEPGSASHVQLEVVQVDTQRSRIEITERFVGTARAAAAPTARVAGRRWETKLLMLCLLAMPALTRA